MRLKAVHFVANSSFVGTPRLEFGSHFSGFTSSLPRYFEYNSHQPVVEVEDDGVRLVKLHGMAFVPCTTADIMLGQGPRAPITKVVSRAFAGLRIQDRAFNLVLDWMQASFTVQADETYNGHIRTHQEPQQVEFVAESYRWNALPAHLWSAFLGHFLPNPGASTDRKEERE